MSDPLTSLASTGTSPIFWQLAMMAQCGTGAWHDMQTGGVCFHPQIVQQMRDQAKTFVVEDMTVEHTITGACSQGPGKRDSPCCNGSAVSPFGYAAQLCQLGAHDC